MSDFSPNVCSVRAGDNFLQTLADALREGLLPGRDGARAALEPIPLAEWTVLLPTRRACRAFQDVLLRGSGSSAVLLPRIRPLSDVDDQSELLSGAVSESAMLGAYLGADLDAGPGEMRVPPPPAVPDLERRLVLMQFVMTWLESVDETGDVDRDPSMSAITRISPAQAAALANDLARLMDEIEIEGADLSRLAESMPPEFAQHWQRTLDFLDVATQAFPAYLSQTGRTTRAARATRLLRDEAGRISGGHVRRRILIAGIASLSAQTRPLIEAVARFENGVLVLPGLDRDLDDAAWDTLGASHPEHPQSGLCDVLRAVGITRTDVRELQTPRAEIARYDGQAARVRLLSEAMRPAATTGAWQGFAARSDRAEIDAALSGISLLDAPTAQDEADAVAIALREALETPGRSAALVTPDRTLARRVSARLAAWNIQIDDSAGRPLLKTVPGTFLDLILACFDDHFSPRTVAALLKHPLTRLGLSAGAVRRAAGALELLAFRQVYLGSGLDAIRASLMRASVSPVGDSTIVHRAVSRLSAEDREAASALLSQLEVATAPMREIEQVGAPVPLRALVRAHLEVAEALSRREDTGEAADGSAAQDLWRGEAGEAAADVLAELLEEESADLPIVAADYAAIFRALIGGQVVRPRRPMHPRLAILGPLEARLQTADLIVLAGLNDGKWPRLANPDPWINRPMRADVGLPAPEQRIGMAAHDFVQLAAAPRVILTRAERIDGTPTVPSRWLMRIEAVLRGVDRADALRADPAAGEAWLAWSEIAGRVGDHRPISAPRPRPPVALRPRRMSVTRVESWLANPYSVYARSILKLSPLDPLEAPPDASIRGRIIHEAVHRFTVQYPGALPDAAADKLVAIADEILIAYVAHPRVAAFWRPRLRRFAEWFAQTEGARRDGVAKMLTEVDGARTLSAPGGDFTLTARADRIDASDKGLVIYDYKSGTAPSVAQVTSGVSPQLPLEAAIAEVGGFDGLDAVPVQRLVYISAGGGTPAGEERWITKASPAELAARSLASLSALVAQYDDPATDYRAVRRGQFAGAYRYDDYAHLARVAEWSVAEGGDE
ncbi:MAG: double-strand break repair protein AddB [Pseudomonadota bacterium]